jgi:type VI secretion system protein ImpL
VRRYQEGGSWSLFRLIGKGPRRAEAGGSLVTFSDGSHSATFRLRETSGGQPFGRGGVWSFRCPAAL